MVLISTKVKGQTLEGYDTVLTAVREFIKQAPGFIMHCAHPDVDEWKVYEVWESKTQTDKWFGNMLFPIFRRAFIQNVHIKSCIVWLHLLNDGLIFK